MRLCAQEQRTKAKAEGTEKRRTKRTPEQKETAKKFLKGMVSDSEYQGDDYDVFSTWLGSTQAA